MKLFIKLFLLLSVIALSPADSYAQQNEMFTQKKERKRIWRRWRKNREAYNPYVDAKGKNKPSARMARGNKKELKRQKRVARRELRKNKKKFGSSG
ncbi:MAG: hypothetical protein H0W61_04975 [Bacteroidetes bacterium]|nr:hypothetical protein [Bacteroidota bacterium]